MDVLDKPSEELENLDDEEYASDEDTEIRKRGLNYLIVIKFSLSWVITLFVIMSLQNLSE